jgi:hypothetical protein
MISRNEIYLKDLRLFYPKLRYLYILSRKNLIRIEDFTQIAI